jgi:hypothetical protein
VKVLRGRGGDSAGAAAGRDVAVQERLHKKRNGQCGAIRGEEGYDEQGLGKETVLHGGTSTAGALSFVALC